MWYIPVLLFFLACLGIIYHRIYSTINLLICQDGEPSPVSREPSPVSCVDSLGVLLKPDYLTQHFEIIIKKNNLKKIRYHDLRHSCASLLLANGVSLKEIQDWLGHLDYSTTANIYSHLEYGAKLKSAGKISETLNIKREKKDGE